MDDFSTDHMNDKSNKDDETISLMFLRSYGWILSIQKIKKSWYSMIQLLPESYNQMRTCTFSYENAANIYYSRKNHKLSEWHTFCEWIEKLPYFKEFFSKISIPFIKKVISLFVDI